MARFAYLKLIAQAAVQAVFEFEKILNAVFGAFATKTGLLDPTKGRNFG